MLVLLRLANILLIIGLIVGLAMIFILLARSQLAAWRGKSKKRRKLNAPSAAGVRDLLAQERIEEAVDLYQRFAGVDEFTAREAVEQIQREMRLADDIQPDVQRIYHEQGKAAAIEAYQDATGADLADALDYVEQLERKR